MPIREIFKQIIAALLETKLRRFLTMFGITSVILLVGLSIGFSVDQAEHLKSIGMDIAICFGRKAAIPSGGYAAGRLVLLNLGDALTIKQDANLIKKCLPGAAPNRQRSEPVERLPAGRCEESGRPRRRLPQLRRQRDPVLLSLR
jgi:hypothetical protein